MTQTPEPQTPEPQTPVPQVPVPQVPVPQTYVPPQQAPGRAPYSAGAAYAPVRRPRLSAREKRGAAWGGIVGFNLLTVGFSMFVIPIAFGLFGAFFSFIAAQIERTSTGRADDNNQLGDFLDTVDLGAWVIPAIVVAVLGLAVMAGALLASKSILSVHQVNRPWGVTWAGAGVAIVGFWFLSWIPGILIQILSGILGASGVGVWANIGISGVLFLIIGIVANGVIGWLAWWWMAHALRRDAVAVAVAAATLTTT